MNFSMVLLPLKHLCYEGQLEYIVYLYDIFTIGNHLKNICNVEEVFQTFQDTNKVEIEEVQHKQL